MLVNMNTVLQYAEEKRCCIGAFDTPNLEILMAVLCAAQERNEPVIIQHAQLHEPEMAIRIIGPVMVRMAKEAKVPVCVMLDHGEDMEYVKMALDLGFTAVMYDGSSKSYEENVGMTREVVAMARDYGANVEAEIGIVTGHEGREFKIDSSDSAYTDPELAARYVKETGIDALAASVGTVHGFYTTKPNLDFDRIVKIKEMTGVPLVMHGGSGISVEDTQRAIRCGIRKINYFSYMSHAGVEGVKKLLEKGEVKYFHDLANAAVEAMKEDVLNAMAMFALEERA
ncbi:class II fructose-bisphosphate aldolase [Clostridium sp. AM58-1XD]|uniref:class II fructose-bisphosphate aldolase n=1 Tax=Clostridium sp. AM58-1XD TaxID=2292307 RepID=UPI000E4BB1BA|nr:class II fructose-bisphosphate aldolase [Clostridium sp. AM58-1XD]RGY96451.1 class II fructose-bisphosphate aldolase [Clostridium sp. AM58-1XD]